MVLLNNLEKTDPSEIVNLLYKPHWVCPWEPTESATTPRPQHRPKRHYALRQDKFFKIDLWEKILAPPEK